ncbi:hypothetical protein GOBAR_DD28262 [Gossypium barbadense]|nr:hypothetical protein GOBAR_DD28262 [Gossypium barbadense]
MSAPIGDIEESRSLEDWNTKKSEKDKLLGVDSSSPGKISGGSTSESEGDFELLEDDVRRYFVNGISSIDFSDRIKQILIKDMEKTVVLKLLRCSIGYVVLFNQAIGPPRFHVQEIDYRSNWGSDWLGG